ncbi:thiamine-phosphate synthase [Pullulanibacillus camelliae]|uniref:Thiamine-phosphate synthase n=1 Tax=Pullulanibacillus camelliae TaxID=1707096 RepID=A0A8J2YLD0_9BACL|nr:thiamine phosphate synthase [Pullulanibacillus camelliae]GGE52912.1 thiamine-phosphate synthase [Pullulanibacillus camelliae]
MSILKPIDYSVYLVTQPYRFDQEEAYFAKLEAALRGGVTLVQLREKSLSTRELLQLAQKVKRMTGKYKVPLIINDRLDIALAVEADGLHVGQEDLPVTLARRFLGKDKIIGVSAETVQQAQQAAKEGADYLGVGSIFPTQSKKDATPVSLETLRLIKQSVPLPIVAIGGISLSNIDGLTDEGLAGVAVISAILSADNPEQAARDLLGTMKRINA